MTIITKVHGRTYKKAPCKNPARYFYQSSVKGDFFRLQKLFKFSFFYKLKEILQ